MTYAETLDYLYNTLPMFSRMGSAAFKKDLTNTRLLCERLQNPQQKFKSIHVGGTNGKGSVSHMLAAVFQENGSKTGLYTSPHLYDFRERIRLNGEMVSEEFVISFVEKIKPLAEEIQPSFFELTVAMAFQYFAEQNVDVAIIEVGLGGRLDSTNIITPELSIITNIGWDHMNLLGNSLPEIAAEKAGIIKKEVPVVIGETVPETKVVFEEVAAKESAPLSFAEGIYNVQHYKLVSNGLEVSYKKSNGEIIAATTDLPGIYQVKNLQTVLAAIDVLREQGWRLESENVAAALSKVKAVTGLQGRWEKIHEQPTVVLEVAHNKDGLRQMFHHIAQLCFGRLRLVFGMVKDKDVDSILSLLPISALYYFTEAAIPRALPVQELRTKATAHGLKGESYANVNLALEKAVSQAAPDDLIVVCGSIFLVAEVNREFLTKQP